MPSEYTLEQVTDIYGKRLDLHREELDALKERVDRCEGKYAQACKPNHEYQARTMEDLILRIRGLENTRPLSVRERINRIRRPRFPWRLRIERRSL